MALTAKQQAFINEYLHDFNATQAAIRAGYSERTAGSIGHQNLKKLEISEEIERRIEENTMSANEVLIRLAEQARAEYGEYIGDDGRVDLVRMKQDGKMHLVKGIKETQHGRTVEFYDAQSALVKIGETHGLFKEKQEIDNRVTLRVEYGDDGTNDTAT